MKKNQIGFCDNKDLRIKKSGGHYVYIDDVRNGKAKVHVITSLENKHHVFDFNRIRKVREGYLYPIPRKDANFKQWSAINLSTIQNVPAKKIKPSSRFIRKRHRSIFRFYTQKKRPGD